MSKDRSHDSLVLIPKSSPIRFSTDPAPLDLAQVLKSSEWFGGKGFGWCLGGLRDLLRCPASGFFRKAPTRPSSVPTENRSLRPPRLTRSRASTSCKLWENVLFQRGAVGQPTSKLFQMLLQVLSTGDLRSGQTTVKYPFQVLKRARPRQKYIVFLEVN